MVYFHYQQNKVQLKAVLYIATFPVYYIQPMKRKNCHNEVLSAERNKHVITCYK